MNDDTLSQAKAYARQFLLEGTIRNHNLFLNTCIELKQRAGDPEAFELLRKLNELESSYTTQPLKEDADYMLLNCGACSHQYRVRKGQGVIASKCPSCGRQINVMTGEESITSEKPNANITVTHKLTISQSEAVYGTKKLLTLRGKHLEVTIPAGVRTGTQVRLSGALQITDGHDGDILIQIKVRSRQRTVLAATIVSGVFILLLIFVLRGYFSPNSGGPAEISQKVVIDGPTKIIEDGYILVGADNKPLELVNNHLAANPTYSQLIAFIKADSSDEKDYVDGVYICGDFAETIHNNAEAAGIKAALVTVYFYDSNEGHALNAFQTTDIGLVFIDCTGGTYYQQLSRLDSGNGIDNNHDKIAYLESGKILGVISLNLATSTNYSFYEGYELKINQYEQMCSDYNSEVSKINQAIDAHTISHQDYLTQHANLDVQKTELISMGNELFPAYKPLGTVSSFNIHW